MLALGGSSYTTFWDQALSANASKLGINAANVAKAMGVGIEDRLRRTTPAPT